MNIQQYPNLPRLEVLETVSFFHQVQVVNVGELLLSISIFEVYQDRKFWFVT